MKKSILLIFLCSFFLSCGNHEEKGSDLISHVDKNYRIRTIVKVDGIAWFARMREGIYRFAQETGMDCSLSGPSEANAELQIREIEKAIQENVDAICIVPFDVGAVEDVLEKARRQGIVVIAHEASNIINADYVVEAFEDKAYGEHLMDHLAELMNYRGEYLVVVGSYGSRSHMAWQTAAVARQKERYPEMAVYGNWIEGYDGQSIIYDASVEAIRENPKIRGILGAPMSTAPGAGLAVEILGMSEYINVVTTSLVSVSASQLENGSVDLISFWDPADAGYVLNLLAVMALEGMDIKEGMDLRVPGYRNLIRSREGGNHFYGSAWFDVTRENMEDYIF